MARASLASRPLALTPEEALARVNQRLEPGVVGREKGGVGGDPGALRVVFGHELDQEAIEGGGYDYELAGRRPSALRLPSRVLLVGVVVRDINDTIVGRRSVVDGAEPLLAPGEREDSEETAWADELRFSDSLRAATASSRIDAGRNLWSNDAEVAWTTRGSPKSATS